MGKKIIFSVVLGLLIFSISVAFSFAWFFISESFFPSVSGDSVMGYFKDGDGSAKDPYIIETPTHVYNLAWLQYMGFLNQESTDSEGNPIITQYYFKISDEIDVIDMEGVVIPPIGTSENPFVGHFDGNGKCISNLTVSNYLSDGENEFGIEKRPLSVTTIDGESVSIVGFFGVVGALDEATKAKLADDSGIEKIEEKVNAVYNLFLDNLTVRTETDRSLIGLFAGYVNGSVTNVGIGESSIAVGEDTTPLTAEDAFDMQLTISAYSLIGKYDETNVEWVDKPTGGSGGGGNTGGSGAGWGGSLDILELNKRITYISSLKMQKQSDYYYSYDNDYKLYATVGYQLAIPYLPKTNNTIYLMSGTILPLNIDAAKMFKGGEIASYTSTNAVTGLVTTDAYKNGTPEIVLSTNTGFIVGSGANSYSGSSAGIRTGIQKFARLVRAYGGNTSTEYNKDVSYSTYANKLILLGYDGKGNFNQISDSYNTVVSKSDDSYGINNTGTAEAPVYVSKNSNYSNSYSIVNGNTAYYNYTSVRDSLDYMFIEGTVPIDANANTSKTWVHALRFYEKHGKSLGANKVVDVADDTKMAGQNVSDLLMGSIDFRVKSEGYITAVATTAFGSGPLFRLYSVDRDANNKISQIHQISKIYRHKTTKAIVYDFADSTTERTENEANYELIFDYPTESNENKLPSYALYYFEIPIRAGEYALGADTSTSSTYLMYLDIGSNGDQTPDGGDDGSTTVPAHRMTAVTFVDSAAIANKTTADYSVITFEVKIGSGISEHDGLTMSFNRTSPTYMSYSQNDPSSAFTVTLVKDDTQLTVEKVQNMSIADFQKKRYFRRRETEI